MYKAYCTKLDLNNEQRTLMAKHAGFGRWVYNWALRLWKDSYKEGLKPNASTLRKLFTNHVKPKYSWMKELSSKVYQYAFIRLKDAFTRFFKKLAEYPRICVSFMEQFMCWSQQQGIWQHTHPRCDRKNKRIKWRIDSTGAIACLRSNNPPAITRQGINSLADSESRLKTTRAMLLVHKEWTQGY